VKALCWEGVNKLAVEQVPDPVLCDDQDVTSRCCWNDWPPGNCTGHLATHTVSLDEAPRAYGMFKQKSDGCVRAVIRPGG
jgi:hypothetical protein